METKAAYGDVQVIETDALEVDHIGGAPGVAGLRHRPVWARLTDISSDWRRYSWAEVQALGVDAPYLPFVGGLEGTHDGGGAGALREVNGKIVFADPDDGEIVKAWLSDDGTYWEFDHCCQTVPSVGSSSSSSASSVSSSSSSSSSSRSPSSSGSASPSSSSSGSSQSSTSPPSSGSPQSSSPTSSPPSSPPSSPGSSQGSSASSGQSSSPAPSSSSSPPGSSASGRSSGSSQSVSSSPSSSSGSGGVGDCTCVPFPSSIVATFAGSGCLGGHSFTVPQTSATELTGTFDVTSLGCQPLSPLNLTIQITCNQDGTIRVLVSCTSGGSDFHDIACPARPWTFGPLSFLLGCDSPLQSYNVTFAA